VDVRKRISHLLTKAYLKKKPSCELIRRRAFYLQPIIYTRPPPINVLFPAGKRDVLPKGIIAKTGL